MGNAKSDFTHSTGNSEEGTWWWRTRRVGKTIASEESPHWGRRVRERVNYEKKGFPNSDRDNEKKEN